ncbi:MAG: DEAD/DEAH box helicase family protein, partial [bacterium]|nr:DEAD/DEAH box helicase family protein [bacterium]
MATSTNKKCSSKTGTNSVFPDYVKFKLDWRPYQARILDELKKHLQDRHFHVVAAPGSGKTVLGLEVVLRIGEPTLVLTPGLSIRDQWIQRFIDLFLPDDLQPAWVSNNLKEPGLLTVTTYQALYAFCKEELPDKDDTGKKKKKNDAPENESEEEREDGDEEDGDVDEEELEQDEKKTKKKAYKFNPEKIARKLAAAGIKNLVFDEAHHLRRQWWKIVSR